LHIFIGEGTVVLMLPSSSELAYFFEVSQTLNISRAAERLGVSQPTLSLAIQRLEHQLGNPLLLRTKKGVQLTRTGQKLAAQARELLEGWEKIRATTLRAEDEIFGPYTLGCHPSVAIYSLPGLMPELLAKHPNLEIRLVHAISRKITEDVMSFKIDFGIVVNPWNHPDLVIKTLCFDEVKLWKAKSASKLQGEKPVLWCDPELMQTQDLLKQFKKFGVEFSRVMTTSNLEVIHALVAAGAGVGILPTRVAMQPGRGTLVPALPKGPGYQDRICLVYRADAQSSTSSRKLAQSIIQGYPSLG